MSAINAFDVAKWFIRNGYDCPRNKWDGNMKLQKLLCFAQLVNLVRNGELLFENPMYAFDNGTVVEDVRLYYKHNHEDLIKQSMDFNPDFSPEQLETLEITANIFGKLDPKELSSLNHLQKSWKNAHEKSILKGGFRDKELSKISLQDIKMYDLEKISEVLTAYNDSQKNNSECEVINGITFYYDPKEIELTDELIKQLETFKGDDKSYTILKDEDLGVVIY